jgi:hypothetical protein
MMSHLDPSKGSGKNANCLKSKRSPSEKVKASLSEVGLRSTTAPNEAVCAAHLNMLCEHALDALEEFGRYESDPARSRGLLLDYKFLPGAVPNVLLPHFGLAEAPSSSLLTRMAKESVQYSKSGSRHPGKVKAKTVKGVFIGDSEDKEKRSTDAIDEWAQRLMAATYEKMGALSLPAIASLSRGADLAAVSVIPGSESVAAGAGEGEGGDEAVVGLPSYAYEPFRNTHNSSRYEVYFFRFSLHNIHLYDHVDATSL